MATGNAHPEVDCAHSTHGPPSRQGVSPRREIAFLEARSYPERG